MVLWGMPNSRREPGDVVGRRLAAVQLVETGAAARTEVAAGFGVSTDAARRWSRDYEGGGALALGLQAKGPKRASKLTEDKRQEIRAARATGRSMAEVAEICGVSLNSVSRALRGTTRCVPAALGRQSPRARDWCRSPAPSPVPPSARLRGPGCWPGRPRCSATVPACRWQERCSSCRRWSPEGWWARWAKVYGSARRACFYGLTSVVLTVVFSALAGEPRAEGLSRVDPVALGRLLGMDRAPEVGTWRRRMEELATLGRSEDLVVAMAAAHLAANEDLPGIFCLDGHVRAYHGRSHLPKAHLARARLAMPGTVDTWVTDARGDGVMVWTGAPGAALSAELARAMTAVRSLVGPDARPTLVFDRGGRSPAVFAEVVAAGFHILTYRKGKTTPEPRSAFVAYDHVDDLGHAHTYHLADRAVRLAYKQGKLSRRLAMRQVTRWIP